MFYPLRQGDIRLGGTLWGTVGLEYFNERDTDIEWLAEARFALWKKGNIFFNGGAGTRLRGLRRPDLRMIASIGGWTTRRFQPAQAPQRHYTPDVEMHDKDTDGDGYPDDIDQCRPKKKTARSPTPTTAARRRKIATATASRRRGQVPNDPETRRIMDTTAAGKRTRQQHPDTKTPARSSRRKEQGPRKNGCKRHESRTRSGIQLLEPIQLPEEHHQGLVVPDPRQVGGPQVSRQGSNGYLRPHRQPRRRQMNRNLSKDRARLPCRKTSPTSHSASSRAASNPTATAPPPHRHQRTEEEAARSASGLQASKAARNTYYAEASSPL